jgi:hypothetical protein
MRNHPVRTILIATVALAVVGAAALAWHLRERRDGFYTDADTIRRAVDDTAPRDVLWRPARPLDALVNTGGDEYEPRVTADGHALMFVRGKAGENADIWWTTRTPDGWGEPQPLDAVNTDADELGPEPSPDGLALYFYSNREGGVGGYDLWVSHLVDGAWQPPLNVGPPVNTPLNEYGTAITPDGHWMYFASNRPRPDDDAEPRDPDAWVATVREDLFQRDYDLYLAALTPNGPGRPVPVAELNSEHNDGSPALSPAGDFIYISSDRPGGHGGFDLYRARRLRGEHLRLENLGPSVNTAANELDPGLDLGGFGLHFSTNRDAASTAGSYDLYRSTSREVFLEQETYRATVDWLALLPYLIWLLSLLLLLLLLLLLARFLKSRGFQRLSLIARCLLASALVHMLIMILLAFWGVSASLSDWLEDGRGTRVALVTHRGGDDVAAQVRGDLTNAEIEPEIEPAERAETALETEAEPVETTEIAVERARFETEPTPQAHEANEAPEPAPDVPLTTVALDAPAPEIVEVTLPDAAARADGREAETPEHLTPAPARERVDARPATPTAVASAVEVAPAETAPTPDDAAEALDAPALADHAPAVAASATPVAIELPESDDRLPMPTLDEARPRDAREAQTRVDPAAPSLARSRRAPAETPATPAPLVATTIAARSSEHPPTPAPTRLTADDAAASTPVAGLVASDTTRLPRLDDTVALPPLPPLAEANPRESPEARTRVDPATRTVTRAKPAPAPASATPAPLVTTAVTSRADLPDPATSDVATTSDAPASTPVAGLVARDTPQLPALDESVALPPMPEGTSPARDAEQTVTPTARLATRRRSDAAAPAPDASPNARVETTPGAARVVDDATTEIAVSDARPTASPVPTGAAPSLRLDPTDLSVRTPVATALAAEDTPDRPDVAPASASSSRRALADLAAHTPAPRVDVEPSRETLDESALATRGRPGPHDAPLDDPRLPAARTSLLERIASDLEPALDLDLPKMASAPGPYAQREPERREKIVEEMGGSEETERAVALALEWLARHQADDGRWDSRRYDDGCGRCAGASTEQVDIATTGLALLGFFGTSHTHDRPGPYQETVLNGLAWLLAQQSGDGSLMGVESMYSHGIATIALAEAYGLTRDPELRDPLERAVMFIVASRNRAIGGWRYAPGQVGDTSVLGWQIMALKAARQAGIPVPQRGFEEARKWLGLVASRRRPGLYAYQPRHPVSPAMTAEATFVNQLIGARPEDTGRRSSIAYVLDHPPRWDTDAATYFWYYATLAMYQHQGPAWEQWNERVKDELLAHQLQDGREAGSWPVADQWSRVGGRVYQTAICTLTLEVYYRYLPGFVTDIE